MLIIVTVAGICVARYCAVFPLSMLINWFIRYRAKRRGRMDTADELPWNYQAMLFWAGLRGAVGVALAAGLSGPNAFTLKATVLVVVVLTVIIFGGTTARMLEILGIQTGVIEEIDSDDEFDIEAVTGGGGFVARGGTGFGNIPNKRRTSVQLDTVNLGLNGSRNGRLNSPNPNGRGFASGSVSPNPGLSRKNSVKNTTTSETELLDPDSLLSDNESDSDLPPQVRRSPRPPAPTSLLQQDYPMHGERDREASGSGGTAGAAGFVAGLGNTVQGAGAAVSHLLSGTSDDHAEWFRQLDEGFIKPTLLLDGGNGRGGSPHPPKP